MTTSDSATPVPRPRPCGPAAVCAAAATLIGLPLAPALAAQPSDWGIGMQTPATPVMREMLDFHNLLLIIITAIVVLVLALLAFVMWRFSAKRNPTPSRTSHNTIIEVVWTAVPVLILLVIAVPSFRLLYLTDRVVEPELTVVVTGYRWYWGYSLPDQQIGEYTSNMIPEERLTEDQVRLLSVDRPLVLPVDTTVQVLVRAADVLHAWAVPAFGVKTDAVPGQTNHTWVRIEEPGTYFGQCSEICGAGHGFMPVEVRAVSREEFDDWVMDELADRQPDTPPVLLTQTYDEARARLAAADSAP